MASILVTGASSGFGQLLSDRLGALGHCVFAGSRSGPRVAETTRPGTPGVVEIELDVRNPESCERARDVVSRHAGGLDVLVNNAGVLIVGAVEDFSEQDLHDIVETNLLGAVRMTQCMLPMLRSSRGRVINVSSIAGVSAAPLYGLYSATKYAMEGLTEALSFELLPFGIRTVLVRPGYFATGMRSHARRAARFDDKSPYWDHFAVARRAHGRDAARAPDPTPVVDALCAAALDESPPASIVIGSDANLASRLRAAKPDRLRDLMLQKYGLSELAELDSRRGA